MGDEQRSRHYNLRFVAGNNNPRNNLKRKNEEHENLDLNLDLSLGLNMKVSSPSPRPSPNPNPNPAALTPHPLPSALPNHQVHQVGVEFVLQQNNNAAAPRRPVTRSRRTNNNNNNAAASEVETIVPRFPWATNRPAGIHPLERLNYLGLSSIEGEVVCRRCDHRGRIEYDLASKFQEMASFVIANAHDMHDRAPAQWMNPTYPDCSSCKQPNCMRPVLADRKEEINWLFLFLGQTLGICTLEQLKWFCKHTHCHRTGAKDRVLYLSYIAMCKQLQPDGTFAKLVSGD